MDLRNSFESAGFDRKTPTASGDAPEATVNARNACCDLAAFPSSRLTPSSSHYPAHPAAAEGLSPWPSFPHSSFSLSRNRCHPASTAWLLMICLHLSILCPSNAVPGGATLGKCAPFSPAPSVLRISADVLTLIYLEMRATHSPSVYSACNSEPLGSSGLAARRHSGGPSARKLCWRNCSRTRARDVA